MIAIFLITNIVNQSLTTREFPFLLKLSHVRPRLTKDNLDKEILKNYRSVANIPFLSKVIEKVVATQTHNYVEAYNLMPTMHSAYRKHHSTETTLLRVTNGILWTIDRRQDVVLVLLDLSAAFDTIDHAILVERLTLVLKTDSMLVQILPWKPSAINSHWRSSVYSLRSASWYPIRVYTCTIAFHPVYRPSSRCNCSP